MRDHAERLARFFGEPAGIRAFRKHATWYTKGFAGSARLRERLTRVASLDELDLVLRDVDADEPFPPHAMRVPRGKSGGRQRVVLPEGYLDTLDDDTPPDAAAEDPSSGG